MVHPNKQPPVVGIVGGIGSGKSSIVRLVKTLKLHIVDADRIGHRLLLDAEICQALRESLGDDILTDGVVDRRKLAALVFGETPEAATRREQLNAIMHPAIRRRMRVEINSAPSQTDLVVVDAALLLEAGWAVECDAIVYIDTPLKLRRERVLATRAWTSAELRDREAAQWPLDRKRAAAHFIVDNARSPEAAAAQLAPFLQQMVDPPTHH